MNNICHHLTIDNHKIEIGGEKLWVCSCCGKKGKWDHNWGYFGNYECKKCWMAAIDYVACSDKCRQQLEQLSPKFISDTVKSRTEKMRRGKDG